jgi:hypothetical protein
LQLRLIHEDAQTSAGKLKTIGYKAATRTLRVELDDGSALEYTNVGESIWRNFCNAGAQWSYYRDNIEEFNARRVSSRPVAVTGKNPLDELFG